MKMKSANQGCVIYALDRCGGMAQITESAFQIGEYPFVWIRLSLAKAKAFLTKQSHIPAFVVSALTAEETRPRTFVFDNTLVGTLRSLFIRQSVADTATARILISEQGVITVERRKISAITDIATQLAEGIGPGNSATFLTRLVSNLVEQSTDVISDTDDQIAELEADVREGDVEVDRQALNSLRRQIIKFRRYLVPQREAIHKISADQLNWLKSTHMSRLRECADSNVRMIEDLDAMRERASVVHEELFAFNQERMNQKMYLLSIVALIFMPLSFITGLLGVNVGGIPGANLGYGFWVLCVLLLGIFILQFLYLRKKHWI